MSSSPHSSNASNVSETAGSSDVLVNTDESPGEENDRRPSVKLPPFIDIIDTNRSNPLGDVVGDADDGIEIDEVRESVEEVDIDEVGRDNALLLKEEVQDPSLPLIPKVRRTGYEGFKNFFGEEEARYAIDVLEAGYSLKEEVAEENLKRGKRNLFSTGSRSKTEGGIFTDEIWIQRVRIKSPFILAHLKRIFKSQWIKWDKPRTFFRPFHAFIHFQEEVKEVLELVRETVEKRALQDIETGRTPGPEDRSMDDLFKTKEKQTMTEKEKKRGKEKDKNKGRDKGKDKTKDKTKDKAKRKNRNSDDRSDFESDAESIVSSSSIEEEEEEEASDEILYCQEAVEHLQCYVDFVDKHIMHLADLFKDGTRQRVRCSDLAYLFHPGDVVLTSTKSESTRNSRDKPATTKEVYQPIWKIQYTNPPSISESQPEKHQDGHQFYISCYYIDFDGSDYGPVKCRFEIKPYEGEIDIRKLPLYPIRYQTTQNTGSSLRNLDRRRPVGRDFQSFVQEKHWYYRGWTLTTSPNGETLQDSNGETARHPEHIDSNVIVDFTTTLEAIPSWKPVFRDPTLQDEEWTTSEDILTPVYVWPKGPRRGAEPTRRFIEITQLRDSAHAREVKQYAETDPFLTAFVQDKTGTDYQLSDDDLELLPGRVMAYVLRDRKFVQLDVHYLTKVEEQSNVFDNLKIDDHHKEMVLALVDSHFSKKRMLASEGYSVGQDLIHGKGEGLVILLHGVPGVGKTATAEAVAQSKRQPLFVITSGDLGFTPRDVEKSLEEIFRLAHLWDCVLLLDEADIFLTERTRDDLKRNALVSVFLRALEYYSGILFLTTNRVGTLDEAFKSRIHMSLYYPPLGKLQTLQIFEMNIDRIEHITNERTKRRKENAEKRRKKLKEEEEEKTEKEEKSDKDEKGERGERQGKESPTGNKNGEEGSSSHRTTPLEPEGSEVVDTASVFELVVKRKEVLAFAKKHFESHRQAERWNGRQIRNAFQIASSLAFYDQRKSTMENQVAGDQSARPGPAVLSNIQFEKVERATSLFERYMTKARGGDDKHQAQVDRTRADDYEDAATLQGAGGSSQMAMQQRRWDDRPHTPQNMGRGGGGGGGGGYDVGPPPRGGYEDVDRQRYDGGGGGGGGYYSEPPRYDRGRYYQDDRGYGPGLGPGSSGSRGPPPGDGRPREYGGSGGGGSSGYDRGRPRYGGDEGGYYDRPHDDRPLGGSVPRNEGGGSGGGGRRYPPYDRTPTRGPSRSGGGGYDGDE